MTTIAHLSDCHLFADPQRNGYADVNPYRSLERVLERVVQFAPDYVCVTGDISGDDSAQSYQHFVSLLSRYQLTGITWLLPGNHDPDPLYSHHLGEWDISAPTVVELGEWRVIGMDTRYRGTAGHLSEQALSTLEHQLSARPEAPCLLACHHHPLASDSWMDKHSWQNSHRFMQLVARYSQIKRVIHGHIHAAVRHTLPHCTVQSVPSTCWQWQMTHEFAVDPIPAGFNLIKLHQHGETSSQTIRLI